jgi:hypothetical protein
MIELECACDGGKDSLSMAAAAGGETVMAPGNLVVSAYVGCPDVTKVSATCTLLFGQVLCTPRPCWQSLNVVSAACCLAAVTVKICRTAGLVGL